MLKSAKAKESLIPEVYHRTKGSDLGGSISQPFFKSCVYIGESFQGDQIMEQRTAEQIATEFMKPIYGFCLKRCANPQDAEDLTQEICLRMYRTLLERDDIESIDRFVWTVAHNALANYYRGRQRSGIGAPMEELLETLPSNDDVFLSVVQRETQAKLHAEIAYLAKLQRQIVIMYYYENKKQAEIAKALDLPLGTVKWHLFEAKRDLKRGMRTMRNPSELKFDPIRFGLCGFSGSIGTKGGSNNFFRGTLPQNIVYLVRHDAKTVNEIAQCLGVSPVFVESEAEYLEEYGFLFRQGTRYLANMLIDEPTTEQNLMQSNMYQQAARLFANELYDELITSGALNDQGVFFPNNDHNFAQWSLIPYIAAYSGEKDASISFEEVATIRPDGGHNITYASIFNPNMEPPKYMESMKNWCGPCWNGNHDLLLWTIDTEWSTKRIGDSYQETVKRDLSLFERFMSGDQLSPDEFAYMAEKGYLTTNGKPDEFFTASLQIVWLNNEAKQRLLGIGEGIKEKYRAKFDELKAPFVSLVLENTPKHLRKMQSYTMQYIFHADGWFILHCLKELVGNGKLKLPTEEQKRSLTTIIVTGR